MKMNLFKRMVYIGSLYFTCSSPAFALPVLIDTDTQQTLIDTIYTTLECEGYFYYQILTTYTYKIVFEKELPEQIDYTIHTSEFEYKFLKNPCFDETVKEKPNFCTEQVERKLGGGGIFVDKNTIEIEKIFKKYKIDYVKIPFNKCHDCETVVPEPNTIILIILGLIILTILYKKRMK